MAYSPQLQKVLARIEGIPEAIREELKPTLAQSANELAGMMAHLAEPSRDTGDLIESIIYLRLPYPSRNGGLEQAFIETCERDASVAAYCKINEQKHTFARLRYIKEDGLPAFYSPDFFVRTNDGIYLVETKAQGQITNPNVLRKRKAAVAWCDRINGLPADQRSDLEWRYVLLGEEAFYAWRDKGGSVAELLSYAKLRPVQEHRQGKFAF